MFPYDTNLLECESHKVTNTSAYRPICVHAKHYQVYDNFYKVTSGDHE